MSSLFRSLGTPVLSCVTVLVALASCKPEPDPRSFNEAGVWALEFYDVDQTGLEGIPPPREHAFLLNFDPEANVVAAASCASDGGAASGVSNSTCRNNEASSVWACRCFAYEHVEPDVMTWTEFDLGQPIPAVGSDEERTTVMTATPTDDGNNCKEGDPKECPQILLSPLPPQLFSSDGLTSTYEFAAKAQSIWDNEDLDGTQPDVLLEMCGPCFDPP